MKDFKEKLFWHISFDDKGDLADAIIAASIPKDSDAEWIDWMKMLLQAKAVRGEDVKINKDYGYLLLYDRYAEAPYRSCIIWKYIGEQGSGSAVDMKQEDYGAIPMTRDFFFKNHGE